MPMRPDCETRRAKGQCAASRWRTVALVAGWAVAAAIACRAVAPAGATSGDMHAARSRYPNITGSQIDACELCHVGVQDYRLDPYGAAYSGHGRDFAAIEALDSDGDGYSNLAELLALTFPGKAASHPSGTPAPEPSASPTREPTGTATTPVATAATPTDSLPSATATAETPVARPTPQATGTSGSLTGYLPWSSSGR